MQDDDVIVFEGEGDEERYVPGDVIITLCYDDNNTYERIGNGYSSLKYFIIRML